MDTSSSEIGVGSLSEAALNLIVPVCGEKDTAVLSRLMWVKRTDRSFGLMVSAPSAFANVEVKSSLEKMREVFDVATLDARSTTVLAACCREGQ